MLDRELKKLSRVIWQRCASLESRVSDVDQERLVKVPPMGWLLLDWHHEDTLYRQRNQAKGNRCMGFDA